MCRLYKLVSGMQQSLNSGSHYCLPSIQLCCYVYTVSQEASGLDICLLISPMTIREDTIWKEAALREIGGDLLLIHSVAEHGLSNGIKEDQQPLRRNSATTYHPHTSRRILSLSRFETFFLSYENTSESKKGPAHRVLGGNLN